MRPMGNQRMAVTVTLRTIEAEKLVAERTIKIGLVRCQVIKKIKIPRCSSCWSYTHTKDKCTGPHRQCHKCGGADHKTENCAKKEDMCPLCELLGHRTGTRRCTAFKSALKKARLDERSISRQTSTASALDNNTHKIATNILEDILSQSTVLGKPETGSDIDPPKNSNINNTMDSSTTGH